MSVDQPILQTTSGRHPRGSSWCSVAREGDLEGDPNWCWCRYEIIGGIGQCSECQEDADAD